MADKKIMTPEEKARRIIDEKLCQAGWVIQDMNRLNLAVSLGVAVREFPTSTGEVDYALFIDGEPAGVVEAKREEAEARNRKKERDARTHRLVQEGAILESIVPHIKEMDLDSLKRELMIRLRGM